MNEFFGTQYSQEELQQRVAERRRNGQSRSNSISMGIPIGQGQVGDNSMDMGSMMGGDTLDDIIQQNNNEIHRRQSNHGFHDVDRRQSMMEFGPGSGALAGFQFGSDANEQSDRRQSTGELDMGAFDMNSMNMTGQQMFASSMNAPNPLTINTNPPFQGMNADMMQNMMDYGAMGMENLSADDQNAMNMFSPTFPQGFDQGNMNHMSMSNNFMASSNMHDGLTSHRGNMNEGSGMLGNMPTINANTSPVIAQSTHLSLNQNMGQYNSPEMAKMPALESPEATIESPKAVEVRPEPPPKSSSYNGIYSTSGFDMLGALMKVATRKNPEIDIGKVDMSCAFVVCDTSLFDCPIIYVSDIFERLTGYNKHEVKGQNCRFLQSPEGKVEAGARRDFSDNNSVYYLRQRIENKKEAQRSLINYRKGGQPFMNLLTMIPITGEDDKELRYYVGFQVDLVEKPTSVEGKNASGLYTVDYSQGTLPRYIWQPPDSLRQPLDGGQSISRDDVSTILQSINTSTESELTKRMWDKVLLENTDDVVHVLSLKGLFLYLSPSSRTVLEYDASELVGTALSSVCHPSDIVPVTRELKDTSSGATVNIVFRIRRKKSGYTWFESHGSLCVEQGKGRKCIILVGRERPVYALHRFDIDAAKLTDNDGGIGENEMWTKLSTSGMFLFVSSHVKTLLDRSPDDLVGTSIQTLMRSESRVTFGRCLEKARTGTRVTHKHEIINKRGLVLQAQTTLYPGDASPGSKSNVANSQKSTATSPRGLGTSSPGETSLMNPGIYNAGDPTSPSTEITRPPGIMTQAGGSGLIIGSQDVALASEDNIFDELKTTRCTSWQFELRQMEKSNRMLAEELAGLMASKKKRKRRKGAGSLQRDCANCHTRTTPEWRRGPSGQRDLCNSCGLRWAKQVSRSNSETSGTARVLRQGQSQSDSTAS